MTERYINPQELKLYEDSVNAYRDIVNAIKTAEKKKYAEGRAEGRAKGRSEALIQVAKDMLKMNMPIDKIVEITRLTEDEINRL